MIFGCGYVGERLAAAALRRGMDVVGTTRSESRAEALRAKGIGAVVAESPADLPDAVLAACDAIVDSIPLSRSDAEPKASQPQWLPSLAARLPHLHWAGYLSTTGVYGDTGGARVDETADCHPTSERGRERLAAERAWLASGLPAEVFRIAGIYGPGRNILPKLLAGGYRAVRWQPPHWSNRIHVDDIVAALLAAMQNPRAGRIVNLADDLPLPHDEYVSELARLVGAPAPVILTPEEGQRQLPAAMLDFFRDNKRISNRRLHDELLAELQFPDFRHAVESLLKAGGDGTGGAAG